MRGGRAVMNPQLAQRPSPWPLPSSREAANLVVADQRDLPRLVDGASSRSWAEERWVLASALSIDPVLFVCLLAPGTVLGRRARDAHEVKRTLTEQTWPRAGGAVP